MPVPGSEHLTMDQDVVGRRAGSSSRMKRWTVTMVAALVGFAASGSDLRFALVAVYMIVAPATLDGSHRARERAHRRLHDEAVDGRAPELSVSAAA